MRGAGKWTWHRNKEFLTNAIKRGDEIRLITNPYVPAYRGGNTYQRELRFLRVADKSSNRPGARLIAGRVPGHRLDRMSRRYLRSSEFVAEVRNSSPA